MHDIQYLACLLVCLSQITVKTAKTRGPNYFDNSHHMTPRKVYGWLKMNNFVRKNISTFIIFENVKTLTEKSIRSKLFVTTHISPLKDLTKHWFKMSILETKQKTFEFLE